MDTSIVFQADPAEAARQFDQLVETARANDTKPRLPYSAWMATRRYKSDFAVERRDIDAEDLLYAPLPGTPDITSLNAKIASLDGRIKAFAAEMGLPTSAFGKPATLRHIIVLGLGLQRLRERISKLEGKP
jgi:hypothetical protein